MTDLTFSGEQPDHPDFRLLAAALAGLDGPAGAGGSPEELTGRVVDRYSAQYAAEQQANLLAARHGLNPRMRRWLAAAFLRGLLTGVQYTHRAGHPCCRAELDGHG